MIALLYRRVSTNHQDIEAQESMLGTYCERLGVPIGATFEDEDTSGSLPMKQRRGGRALLTELEWLNCPETGARPEGLILVATRQDRLGRDTLDQISTIRKVWELGVIPHLIAEGGAIPRTPQNELMFEIKAATAQYERNLIRGRIQDKMNLKRANGELCGTVPYGWIAIPTGAFTSKGKPIHHMIDCPEEQKWILYMADRRTQGASYHKIASELNGFNVPTKRGRGEVIKYKSETRFTSGQWQSGNVSHVLNNKTVCEWLVAQGRSKAA